MTLRRYTIAIADTLLVAAVLSIVLLGWTADLRYADAATKRKTVWVVFFFSKSCPNCEPVRDLLDALKSAYPVRVKAYDIDKPQHYALYRRLEAIHTSDSFGIPLVMLGDSILMGERGIAQKLEKMVRRLSKKGGASLPYLGPNPRSGLGGAPPSRETSESAPCKYCDGKGRPPTIQEEWKKIRKLVDTYF